MLTLPCFHRSTMNFIGMAERDHYICYRKTEDYFFALDKENRITCWDVRSGQMLNSAEVTSGDYRGYELDREVYDRDWFSHFVLHRAHLVTDDQASPYSYMQIKVIEIDSKGTLNEKLSFVHSHQHNQQIHLYFTPCFSRMIELQISKENAMEFQYNLYSREKNALDDEVKWIV